MNNQSFGLQRGEQRYCFTSAIPGKKINPETIVIITRKLIF